MMDRLESAGPATEPLERHETPHDRMAAADQAARYTAERLKSVADDFRARAPKEGLAGQVADRVTSGVKQAARQLQEQGFGGLIDDLVVIGKRYPVPMLILGIGGAFLFSRFRRD